MKRGEKIMTCPICKRKLSKEEAEQLGECLSCLQERADYEEQMRLEALESEQYQKFEVEPLSGRTYPI